MKNFFRESRKSKAFTLTEFLIVIAILGIIASIVVINLRNARNKAYFSRAQAETRQIATALEFYFDKYDSYPEDVSRDLPPGIEEFLGPGEWPTAPWPSSVYDWDNWDISGDQVYQISIRFCPLNDPGNCQFPNEDWASDFDYYSSVYYCLEGPCRSHVDTPIDHPGYCLNCE